MGITVHVATIGTLFGFEGEVGLWYAANQAIIPHENYDSYYEIGLTQWRELGMSDFSDVWQGFIVLPYENIEYSIIEDYLHFPVVTLDGFFEALNDVAHNFGYPTDEKTVNTLLENTEDYNCQGYCILMKQAYLAKIHNLPIFMQK